MKDQTLAELKEEVEGLRSHNLTLQVRLRDFERDETCPHCGNNSCLEMVGGYVCSCCGEHSYVLPDELRCANCRSWKDGVCEDAAIKKHNVALGQGLRTGPTFSCFNYLSKRWTKETPSKRVLKRIAASNQKKLPRGFVLGVRYAIGLVEADKVAGLSELLAADPKDVETGGLGEDDGERKTNR